MTTKPSFFSGTGELTKLIERLDWSNTSLGDIAEWHPQLKGAINIILNAAFPMLILWGDDYICFYNDAYRKTLGEKGKHPFMLGKPANEVFAELWESVEPLLNQVKTSGKPISEKDILLPFYRNGREEQVYWTFSYNPITENNKVLGILVICIDTTDTVTKYQRLATHTKAPIAIFKGEDLIIDEANPATLELWRVGAEVIGKPLPAVLPELKEQGFTDLLLNVFRTGESFYGFEMPAYFNRKNGKKETRYYNFEYSPYKEQTEDIAGVMVIASDVTEQVLSKKEKEIAEEDAALAIGAGGLGYWNLNPVTNEFTCNVKAKQLFGLTGEEPFELSEAINSIHPEDKEFVLAAIKYALHKESGGEYDVQYRITNPSSNKLIDVRAKGQAFFNSDNKPFRFSGIIMDITTQKQHERLLKENENRYRALTEKSPDIITRHDKNYIYLYVSPNIHQLTGKLADEFLGRSYRDLGIPEEMCQVFDKSLDTVFTTKKATEVEYRVTGTDQYVYSRLIPEFEGDDVSSVMVISTDISKRKAVEQDLQYQKSLLETVTQNTDMALFLMDEKQYCVYMNEAAEKMTGYSLNEVKGKQLHYYVHHTHPDGRHYPLEECPIDQALPTQNRTKGEETFVHKDGSFYPVAFTASPIIVEGKAIGTVIEVKETSEEKKKDQALQRSRLQQQQTLAQLESLLTNAPIGIAFFDKEHRYLKINETLAEINGIPADFHIGKTVKELLPINAEIVDPIIDKVIATKTAVTNFEVEGETPKAPGVKRYWLTGFYPVLNAELSDVDSVGVLVFEITERKEAEQKLKANEEQFRVLANSLSHLAWMAKPDGWIYWYNQRWYDYTGTTLEEMQGWGWEKVHHPDHIQRVIQEVSEYWQKGEPFEMTFPLRSSDGNFRWFLTKVYPVKDTQGNVLNWIGTNTDIHEHLELQKALQQSEYELKTLADAMPQIVWATDSTGFHDFFNQRWYEFTGQNAEQSKGEGWSNVLHPSDAERTWKVWKHSLETGDPYEIEYRMKRADGEYRWLLARAVPVRDQHGMIKRWFGTCTDIHDQKIIAELLEMRVQERTAELEQANEILLKVNAELQQFNYITAHDLQEPLRKILLYTEMISNDSETILSQSSDGKFRKLKDSVQRMRESLQDLLEYSSIDKFVEPQAVDLNQVVTEVEKDLELLINQKSAIIVKDKLPILQGIGVQIRQLFYNLLHNALKYSKDDINCLIHIRVEETTEEDYFKGQISTNTKYIKIVVADNGIGFEEEHSDKIFQIFQRLHPKSEYPGTGIGLSLCKKIVEKHGGKIIARSKLGKGSEFIILLPLV